MSSPVQLAGIMHGQTYRATNHVILLGSGAGLSQTCVLTKTLVCGVAGLAGATSLHGSLR